LGKSGNLPELNQKVYIFNKFYPITMVMETLQIRIPKNMLKTMDALIKSGIYSNRSDFIRDSIRRFYLNKLVGILPNEGDSVKEIKELRKQCSKDIKNFKDLEKVNQLRS